MVTRIAQCRRSEGPEGMKLTPSICLLNVAWGNTVISRLTNPKPSSVLPPWNQSSSCGCLLAFGPHSKSCLLVSTLYFHVKCQLKSLKYSGIYPLHDWASLFLFVYLFNKYASDTVLDIGNSLPTLGKYTAYLIKIRHQTSNWVSIYVDINGVQKKNIESSDSSEEDESLLGARENIPLLLFLR